MAARRCAQRDAAEPARCRWHEVIRGTVQPREADAFATRWAQHVGKHDGPAVLRKVGDAFEVHVTVPDEADARFESFDNPFAKTLAADLFGGARTRIHLRDRKAIKGMTAVSR